MLAERLVFFCRTAACIHFKDRLAHRGTFPQDGGAVDRVQHAFPEAFLQACESELAFTGLGIIEGRQQSKQRPLPFLFRPEQKSRQ